MSNSIHESSGKEEDPRTRFAGERTMLAWIRTGLAMMGFGFVVARFGLFLRELDQETNRSVQRSTGLSLWIGSAMIVLGVVVQLLAAREHAAFLSRINRGLSYQPPRWSLGIVVAICLAFLGLCMTAYVVSASR